MSLNMIVAFDKNNVIGANGDLLWDIPTDKKFFKSKTTNNTVVMGRNTWESIPKAYRPFKDRFNIVLTSKDDYEVPDDVVLAKSILGAVHIVKETKKFAHQDIFIIGGEKVYSEGMLFADRLFVTEVHTKIDTSGMTKVRRFPKIDPRVWKEVYRSERITDEKSGLDITHVIYERIC